MKTSCFCLALWMTLAAIGISQEQNEPPRAQGRLRSAGPSLTAPPAQPLPPTAGKMVTFEIIIADVNEPLDSPTPAKIFDLEKSGKLNRLARIQLASLEQQSARVQFGEIAPRVVGRTNTGRGGFGGPGGGPPGVQSTPIYNDINLGTVVQVTARVEDDQSIVTQLMVEQSGIAGGADAGAFDPNSNDPPKGIQTLTSQSTVRLKSGEPQIISGRQVAAGKEANKTWIVVTANLGILAAQRKQP
jgi:Bacterial type II and III secretion system protein